MSRCRPTSQVSAILKWMIGKHGKPSYSENWTPQATRSIGVKRSRELLERRCNCPTKPGHLRAAPVAGSLLASCRCFQPPIRWAVVASKPWQLFFRDRPPQQGDEIEGGWPRAADQYGSQIRRARHSRVRKQTRERASSEGGLSIRRAGCDSVAHAGAQR